LRGSQRRSWRLHCPHSFASFLVNEGVSLYVVQALLGHANARTTQRYDTEKSVESKRLLMACSMNASGLKPPDFKL